MASSIMLYMARRHFSAWRYARQFLDNAGEAASMLGLNSLADLGQAAA